MDKVRSRLMCAGLRLAEKLAKPKSVYADLK